MNQRRNTSLISSQLCFSLTSIQCIIPTLQFIIYRMLLEKCIVESGRRWIHGSSGLFSSIQSPIHVSVLQNAYRASLGKPSRSLYQKQYRITIMQPDGSTIGARFKEPCKFVRLPVDLRVADEDERRQRLALRKPQVKQIKEVSVFNLSPTQKCNVIIANSKVQTLHHSPFSGIDRRQFRRRRLSQTCTEIVGFPIGCSINVFL